MASPGPAAAALVFAVLAVPSAGATAAGVAIRSDLNGKRLDGKGGGLGDSVPVQT